MDTLYYSNHCKHCQHILQFLVKGNLANQLNFICIDKRVQDPKTQQINIILENGSTVLMPPNIQRVPSLLLTRQNYRIILGEEILKYFHPVIEKQMQKIPNYQGEPVGVGDGLMSGRGMNIISESFTDYNLSPEELSAKGNGGRRQMHNYVSANHDILTIPTPPDTYQPDKIGGSVTLDKLQQKRIDDIQTTKGFVPKL